MKLVNAWGWESLENLPLLLGFVAAARLWDRSIPAGLVILGCGMGAGVLVNRMVEPRLHRAKLEVRRVDMIANFLLFVAIAIPFMYYFRAETTWTNWKTDFLGGVAAALILTFVQSLHWTGPKSRMLLHSAAMLAAFPVIMLGLRYIIAINGWGPAISYTTLLTLFASLIISLIDYQEMYRN